MFSSLPPEVAVIIYCGIGMCAMVLFLACMWLCSACLAKKAKQRKNETYENINGETSGPPIWTVTDHMNKDFLRKGESPRHHNRKHQNYDTLKHLELLPWWDNVNENSCINWHDYYKMAERKNRAKTGERKRYPWKTSGMGNDPDRRRMLILQTQEEQSRRTPADPDCCWENVQPQNVDTTGFWQHPPRGKDTKYFPRFRMIPRATWSNENLLGYVGPNAYANDYGNHSLASLTSTDMQIMQLVAKRHKRSRESRKDAFIKQRRKDERKRTHNQVNNNKMKHLSPYDMHNEKVARRHAVRSCSVDNYRTPRPEASSSQHRSRSNVDLNNLNAEDYLPPPPIYPAPPTPRKNETRSIETGL